MVTLKDTERGCTKWNSENRGIVNLCSHLKKRRERERERVQYENLRTEQSPKFPELRTLIWIFSFFFSLRVYLISPPFLHFLMLFYRTFCIRLTIIKTACKIFFMSFLWFCLTLQHTLVLDFVISSWEVFLHKYCI